MNPLTGGPPQAALVLEAGPKEAKVAKAVKATKAAKVVKAVDLVHLDTFNQKMHQASVTKISGEARPRGVSVAVPVQEAARVPAKAQVQEAQRVPA